jgi:hypothetical protein
LIGFAIVTAFGASLLIRDAVLNPDGTRIISVVDSGDGFPLGGAQAMSNAAQAIANT